MKDLLKREWEKAKLASSHQAKVVTLWVWLRRLLQVSRSFLGGRYYFRKAHGLGRLVFAKGRPIVNIKGQLHLGNLVRIWSNISQTHLIIGKRGILSIADGAYINGALIAVEKEVRIGKNCYIAPMVQILDNNDFGLGIAGEAAAAVVIEEDAWLATRALITKGVRIGKGAVVAVGAVVTEDVAPYTLVAGVPARPIRQLRAI